MNRGLLFSLFAMTLGATTAIGRVAKSASEHAPALPNVGTVAPRIMGGARVIGTATALGNGSPDTIVLGNIANTPNNAVKTGTRTATPEPPSIGATANDSVEPAPIEIRETDAPVAKGLTVELFNVQGVWDLHAKKSNEIVVLHRGRARSGGATQASLPLDLASDAPIIIETTRYETLETTRTIARVVTADGKPSITLRAAEVATAYPSQETRRKHECRSQRDGFGGITVLCKVKASAGSANISDDNPAKDAVSFSNDEGTLLRFDFDAKRGTVDARVFGYNDGGVGVLARVEMAFLPEEKQPTLTILSADRPQIVPFRRHPHWKHPQPIDFEF